jgi:hypothetical protein
MLGNVDAIDSSLTCLLMFVRSHTEEFRRSGSGLPYSRVTLPRSDLRLPPRVQNKTCSQIDRISLELSFAFFSYLFCPQSLLSAITTQHGDRS